MMEHDSVARDAFDQNEGAAATPRLLALNQPPSRLIWRVRFQTGEHAGVDVDVPFQGASLGGAIDDDISILDVNQSLLKLQYDGSNLNVQVLRPSAVFGTIEHAHGDRVVIAEATIIQMGPLVLEVNRFDPDAVKTQPADSQAPQLDEKNEQIPAVKRSPIVPFKVAIAAGFVVGVLGFSVAAYSVVSARNKCPGPQCTDKLAASQPSANHSGKPTRADPSGTSQKPEDILRDLLAGYRVPARVESTPQGIQVFHAMEDASRLAQIRGEIEFAMSGQKFSWILADEETLESRTPSGSRSLARAAISRMEDTGMEGTLKRFFSGGGRIVQVTVGDTPSISTNRGARIYPGADLGNGLTLAAISNQYLIINGPQNRRIFLNHEGQRARPPFPHAISQAPAEPAAREVVIPATPPGTAGSEEKKAGSPRETSPP
jgi:hypothetical protein